MELRLLRTEGVAADQPVRVRIRPSEGSGLAPSLLTARETSIIATLDAPGAYLIDCPEERVWCPETEVGPSEEGWPEYIELPVHRAVELTGTVRPPPHRKSPSRVRVQGWLRAAPPSRSLTWLNEAVVDALGRFVVKVPRGLIDLRIASDDWIPIYRWSLRATRDTELGTLELVSGSSLAGFVRRADDGFPVADLRLRLEPLREPPADPGRAALLRFDSLTGPRGFFQFAGLPEGRYRLRVESPDLVLSKPSRYVVTADSETFLPLPLEVLQPASLTVDVVPAFPPDGAPWRLKLEALEADGGRSSSTTDLQGRAVLSGLVPGRYRLFLMTEIGTLAHSEDLTIAQDHLLTLETPLIEVRGTVRLGGEPLAATIELETGHGDSWRLASDEEGLFRGEIRKPERILIAEVQATEPSVHTEVQIHEFETEDGVLELDLDLPDEEIGGFVLDHAFQPLPGASVVIEPAIDDGRHWAAQTNENGRFDQRGLAPGAYLVSARRADVGEAGPIDVDLAPGGVPARVTLVLSARVEVRGQLFSAAGSPVPGAEIVADATGPVAAIGVTTSGFDGQFVLRMPRDARAAVLQVYAPSHLAWSGCVTLDPDGLLEVALPPLPGGEIVLETLGNPDLPPTVGGETFLLTEVGGFFPTTALAGWSERLGAADADSYDPSSGVRIQRFPGMSPGSYAVDFLRESRWVLANRLCIAGAPRGLDWKTLSPASHVTLVRDHSRHQREQEKWRTDSASR